MNLILKSFKRHWKPQEKQSWRNPIRCSIASLLGGKSFDEFAQLGALREVIEHMQDEEAMLNRTMQ